MSIFKLYESIERNFKKVPLFWILFIFHLVFGFISSEIVEVFAPSSFDVFDEKFSLGEIFFLSVFLAPLIETFLFQYLIIEVLLYYKINKSLVIVISGLLFVLFHNYNWVYVFFAIFPGLLYASYYIFLKMRKKTFPFHTIVGLHSLYNLTLFLLFDI